MPRQAIARLFDRIVPPAAVAAPLLGMAGGRVHLEHDADHLVAQLRAELDAYDPPADQ